MKRILWLLGGLLVLVVLAQMIISSQPAPAIDSLQESSQIDCESRHQDKAADETSQETIENTESSESSASKESTIKPQPNQGPVRQAPSLALPDTTVWDYQGEPIRLKKLLDNKLTIINFWASWCPPCKEEMPYFQAAFDQYQDQVNFVMVNASQSRPSETMEVAQKYIEESGYTFPIYFDKDYSNQIALGISTLPSTLVVDEYGQIIHAIRGLVPEKVLYKMIEDQIKN